MTMNTSRQVFLTLDCYSPMKSQFMTKNTLTLRNQSDAISCNSRKYFYVFEIQHIAATSIGIYFTIFFIHDSRIACLRMAHMERTRCSLTLYFTLYGIQQRTCGLNFDAILGKVLFGHFVLYFCSMRAM